MALRAMVATRLLTAPLESTEGLGVRQAVGSFTRIEVRVREAQEADEPRILDIGNAIYPEYRETLQELRHDLARLRDGGYVSVLSVAEAPGGQIIGHSHFHQIPWQFDPARFRVDVYVDPAWRRRAAGAALYDHMLEAVVARGGRHLESSVRETMADSRAFLVRRGFRETMRTWETRLDVGRFDPMPFARYLARVRQQGIEITTLADEVKRDPEALRRAHALHDAVLADIPAPIPYTPVPFEQFLQVNVESPRALLNAYFIAKAGDVHIGEANLQRPAEGTHLYHNVTGVLPAYRGRGIAMVLKLATIEFAQAHGHSEIRTWNEVNNVGMLVINDRLGFVRQPAWLTFEREVGAAPEATAPGGPGGDA
jgi:GNAT superfamily N-acetyltransferase